MQKHKNTAFFLKKIVKIFKKNVISYQDKENIFLRAYSEFQKSQLLLLQHNFIYYI
jgi:hypothetical protein